jgi:chromosome segregation ATPase
MWSNFTGFFQPMVQKEQKDTALEEAQVLDSSVSSQLTTVDNVSMPVQQGRDESPIVSTPAATHAVIASSKSHHDDNSHMDNTAAGTRSDNSFEHFRSQIQQMRERYREKRNAIELVVQSKKGMEDRLLLDLKKKDEQFDEICRRNEGYRLKLDVLKREVAGTQELLQARELDFKKRQEQHQNDLHSIKRQLDVSEQLSKQSKDEVERLQTVLQATQMELTSLKQEHETLIGIVKYVASDSEDRRTECRHLRGVVNATNEKNHANKA